MRRREISAPSAQGSAALAALRYSTRDSLLSASLKKNSTGGVGFTPHLDSRLLRLARRRHPRSRLAPHPLPLRPQEAGQLGRRRIKVGGARGVVGRRRRRADRARSIEEQGTVKRMACFYPLPKRRKRAATRVDSKDSQQASFHRAAARASAGGAPSMRSTCAYSA